MVVRESPDINVSLWTFDALHTRLLWVFRPHTADQHCAGLSLALHYTGLHRTKFFRKFRTFPNLCVCVFFFFFKLFGYRVFVDALQRPLFMVSLFFDIICIFFRALNLAFFFSLASPLDFDLDLRLIS